jgi:FO synthase
MAGIVDALSDLNAKRSRRVPLLVKVAPDLDDDDAIAVARLLLGPQANIQAPPNLSPGVYPKLLAAGPNDWGGISPLTLDHINPEAPWPVIPELRRATERLGFVFRERLAIYPEFAARPEFVAEGLRPRIAELTDADGLVKESHEHWRRW